MESQLATTNLLLGILALGSALETVAIVGLAVFAIVILRHATRAVERLEAQQVTPALGKVNDILDDVKGVSGKMKDGAGRFDSVVRAVATVFQTLFDRYADSSKRHDRVM